MKFLLLSKHNTELSAGEAIALLKPKKHALAENLLFVENARPLEDNLAYTKAAYEMLFRVDEKRLRQKIRDFCWQKIYKKDFCVRAFGTRLKEANIADLIWGRLKKPKANLTSAETNIHFFKVNEEAVAGLLIKRNEEKFEERRGNRRPEHHPAAMSPRLARALVNLSGVEKGLVADAFCGVGVILAEAGLRGLRVVGYDIDNKMIERCRKNLDFFKIKRYKLVNEDARSIKEKYDFIVSDLPYGLNSRARDLKETYSGFIANLEKILEKRAVIVFPHFFNYKRLIKKTKLKIEREFTYYLHKSLSRKIVVMSKR